MGFRAREGVALGVALSEHRHWARGRLHSSERRAGADDDRDQESRVRAWCGHARRAGACEQALRALDGAHVTGTLVRPPTPLPPRVAAA